MNPSASAAWNRVLRAWPHNECEAAVLVVVVYLVTWVLGKRLPAHWRFALWFVVFLRLAMPGAPPLPWGVFPAAGCAGPGNSVTGRKSPSMNPPRAQSIASKPPSPHGHPPPPIRQRRLPEAPTGPVAETWFPSWSVCLGLFWGGGFLFLMGRRIWLGVRLARQRRTWRPVGRSVASSEFFRASARIRAADPAGEIALRPRPTGAGPGRLPAAVHPSARGMATRFSPEEKRLILASRIGPCAVAWDVLH